jgi:hypothetical protein
MKKVLTAFLLLTLAAATAYARQQSAPGGARLLDNFGEIQWSDLIARLDNFAIELSNDPSARGLVVAYGVRYKFPGWPIRRARTSVEYLTATRGLDAARLSAVYGGLRDATQFELWVVPPGARLPKPTPRATKAPLTFRRVSV